MLNHIHLLVSSKNNISNIIRDFKSYTSKEIASLLNHKNLSIPLDIFKSAAKNEQRNKSHKVWQSGFHPIGIYSESFFNQKLDYIHKNPVKKDYVSKPEHWFYSSARNYANYLNYPIEIDLL